MFEKLTEYTLIYHDNKFYSTVHLVYLKWQMKKIPHSQNIFKIKLEYETFLKVAVKTKTLTPELGIS